MLITGRHIWRAQKAQQVLRGGKKLTDAQKAARDLEFKNLWPQVMGRAGYQTFFTGKWHISAAADQAFQVARNIRGGMPNQTPEGYNRPLPDKPDPWSPYDIKFDYAAEQFVVEADLRPQCYYDGMPSIGFLTAIQTTISRLLKRRGHMNHMTQVSQIIVMIAMQTQLVHSIQNEVLRDC